VFRKTGVSVVRVVGESDLLPVPRFSAPLPFTFPPATCLSSALAVLDLEDGYLDVRDLGKTIKPKDHCMLPGHLPILNRDRQLARRTKLF